MKKTFAAFIVVALLAVHVVCTVLYNAPVNPVSKYYQPAVNAYMEPYFMQKWLLFAPEPATSDLKLWYRVKLNNKWGHWVDPVAPILAKHQHRRFTYNAKLLYVYGNIAKDLNFRYGMLGDQFPCSDSNLTCIRHREDSLMASKEYKLAMRFAASDFRDGEFGLTNPDSLQLLVIQLYPKQFSDRLSKKPFGFASSTEFKPIQFPKEIPTSYVTK